MTGCATAFDFSDAIDWAVFGRELTVERAGAGASSAAVVEEAGAVLLSL